MIGGLALSLGVPFLPLGTWGRAYSGLGKLWGAEVFWWVAVLVILAYVLFAERRPLSSIGFRRPRGWDIGWGVIFAVVMIVGSGVIFAVILPALHLQPNQAVVASIVSTPVWLRVAMVTRAAVCEEILFRGYPLQRLTEWTGSVWPAGLITWALFTYAHLAGWGAAHLIMAGFAGAMLTALYMWRRNIWINILAHWLVDAVSFLVIPLLAVPR